MFVNFVNIFFRSIECHEETIQCIHFTPDSVCLASGDVSGVLKIWHMDSFSVPLAVVSDAHDLGVLGLEFMPDFKKTCKLLLF